MSNEERIAQLIDHTHGRFFSVQFTKRTTGETRTMLARTGVRKYLKGGQQAHYPGDYKLRVVYDVKKSAYRSIPLDACTSFRCESETYLRNVQ